MPLVRSTTSAPQAAAPESLEDLMAQLGDGDAGARRAAARNLSCYPEAATALAAHLMAEPEAQVRDALFGSLVVIGGALAADLVAPLLRSADAGLRGGAVECLKRLKGGAVSAVDALLSDPDTDVRLLAIEVTRGWSSALAEPRLRHIFEYEVHTNVCGAAVDVATEVGTANLVGALIGLRARFDSEPFLDFAINIALARLQAAAERDA